MCNNWKESSFDNLSCVGTVNYGSVGDIMVKGRVKQTGNLPLNGKMIYWAPAPPDYRSSMSGSGLPFSNYNSAYENTHNKGMVQLTNGQFNFKIYYPNAYYAELGTKYIAPQIMFKVCTDGIGQGAPIHAIQLDNGIPYRMLSYPKNYGVLFYDGLDKLPIRSQETIIRDSAYPSKNIMPANHWGLKPPM